MKKMSGYMHGVNLGGWLSQCVHTKEHYDSFITEKDFETVSQWGMDHVRIPVDYDLVEEKDGTRIESGFLYLQNAIDWCGKYELNMILDLHKTFGFSFDPDEQETGFFDNPSAQERFYRLWEEFARRYGKYASRLSFELLNEVTDECYSDTWNAISAECIRRIRKTAPDIKILVGGYHHNSFHALKRLLPPVDENIVYNFHFYEPGIFTHQGAYWIPTMDTNFRMRIRSTYGEYARNNQEQCVNIFCGLEQYDPETEFGQEFFENCLREAVTVAEERNAALYCGEFGVIDRAKPEDALEWYRMVCSCFDKYGIGHAAWSFRGMDFGLVDEWADDIRSDLLSIL